MRALVLLLCGCSGAAGADAAIADASEELDAAAPDAAATDAGASDSGSPRCSVTLDGSAASCTAFAAWRVMNNAGSLELTTPDGSRSWWAEVRFTGEPMPGRYVDTDPNLSGGIHLVDDGEWEATAGARGRFDFDIATAAIESVDAEGSRYHITGSVTAILDPVPGSGATGSLDLSATFD